MQTNNTKKSEQQTFPIHSFLKKRVAISSIFLSDKQLCCELYVSDTLGGLWK